MNIDRNAAVSRALLAIGVLAIAALGFSRFWQDGSFWIDEALVAANFIDRAPLEVFGRLESGVSFPRFYLLFIRGVSEVFGYETWILRLPPFAFFLAGTVLWLRLFETRFRGLPLLFAFVILLNFLPTTWFVYSSLVKQYTFDVFLALLIFTLPDRTFDSILRDGKSPWKTLLLVLPCALSYTYIFAFFGRVAGWILYGLRRDGLRFDGVAVSFFVVGLLAFNASLYFTDVQHTLGEAGVRGYWAGCLLGSDGVQTLPTIDKLFFSWYRGRTLFSESPDLAAPLLNLLRGFMLLGAAAILVRSIRPGWLGDDPPDAWGSRSLGCVCCMIGFLVGARLIAYPACATRLTLFTLFASQIILLEGIATIHAALRKSPYGAVLGTAGLALLVLVISPYAARDYLAHLRSTPPQNLRPLLHHIRARNELPVLVDACTYLQARTLPEGIGGSELVEFLKRGRRDAVDLIPYGEEAFVLTVVRMCFPFGDPAGFPKQVAVEWQEFPESNEVVRLYRARFGDHP